MSTYDKIKEIEDEMSRTQKNKSTSCHLGILKARLAKLRRELISTPAKSEGPRVGFEVPRTGIARVGLIGLPSVGKSTLMTKLTGAYSEISEREFTTVTVIPGMINYRGASIQLLDLPGIIEGAKDGRGHGKQVIAVARTCSVVLVVLDVHDLLEYKRVIERELEGFGIRLNKQRPDITLRKREKGGINVTSTLELTNLDHEQIRVILNEYKLRSCDISLHCDATTDDLIDAVEAIYAINKIDQSTLEEVSVLCKLPHSIPLSAHQSWNLDILLEMIWYYLDLIRVYTKPPGELLDYSSPVTLRRSARTVEDFCNSIHKSIAAELKYALVWGLSVKYNPQIVGRDHILEDEDVIQLVKRKT